MCNCDVQDKCYIRPDGLEHIGSDCPTLVKILADHPLQPLNPNHRPRGMERK